MYPVAVFPGATVVGVKGECISKKPNSVSFRASVGSTVYVFNAFDGMASVVEALNLDTGSAFTATCEMKHYIDQKGDERDSFKIISISKIASGAKAAPTVMFQNLTVKKIKDGTSSKGVAYKSIIAEEPVAYKGKKPVRILNAWGDQVEAINTMRLKENYQVTVISDMKNYLDKKTMQSQTSYQILSLGYLPYKKKDEEKKEAAPEVEKATIDEPVFDEPETVEAVIEAAAESLSEDAEQSMELDDPVITPAPEFSVSEFDALFE